MMTRNPTRIQHLSALMRQCYTDTETREAVAGLDDDEAVEAAITSLEGDGIRPPAARTRRGGQPVESVQPGMVIWISEHRTHGVVTGHDTPATADITDVRITAEIPSTTAVNERDAVVVRRPLGSTVRRGRKDRFWSQFPV